MRWLLDAVELGVNPGGISRVLAGLVPAVVRASADEVLVACTPAGVRALDERVAAHAVVVPYTLQTRWEQHGMPALARRTSATGSYSHREAGALWGPPLVLHVPEDPEVRWRRNPPTSARALARRLYSRTVAHASLRRAAVVGVSTLAVARDLAQRHRLPMSRFHVLPLGVDQQLFFPTKEPQRRSVFHLGSDDPRDRSPLVLDAYVRLCEDDQPPPLVLGGRLPLDVLRQVEHLRQERNLAIEVLGRLSDLDLAEEYRHAAVVVQPSSDEGFGLQPLEGMASGAPVVVTRTPAVAEVVDDAAVVTEDDPTSLANGIRQALTHGDELRRAGLVRAGMFTWDAAAVAVVAALESAASR